MIRSKIIFPEEIRQRFKSFINNRTGLYFKDYDLKDLDAMIAVRMEELKIDTVLTYYTYLTISEHKEDELRELLNRLTINHTYFFRNEPQFKALKEKILPELIERKSKVHSPQSTDSKPTIRIWSAGCSTGEEPYTIAMIIKDVIPDNENWDIQILATDASEAALERARKGAYGVNSMRHLNKKYLDRYFTEYSKTVQDGKYQINNKIKSMVNFGFFNLIDEDYPQGFDLIFCRNVTIYFELETTVKVMEKFERSLNNAGYLFIGYSETLQFISDKFKMLDWGDAIFYTKAKEAAKPAKFMPSPRQPAPKVEEILEKLSKAEFKAGEAKIEKRKHSAKFEELLVEAIKSSHSKNYSAALSMIDEARSIDKNAVEPYYLTAEIYTNQGKFEDAKRDLNEALAKDMMFAPAYHLLGIIYAEQAKMDEAEKSFRKALYLEKEFSMAHFGLGNIYKEKGHADAALREYRNTLNILSKSKPYDILAYSGGFNVATLSGVCKNNIERLKTAD